MSQEKTTGDNTEQRLKHAEASLEALSLGEVDLFIGAREPLIVRFKSLVEEKERQSRLLEALIQTAPTLILMTDFNGRIARFNETCIVTTGYSLEEALGKTIPELFRTQGWGDTVRSRFGEPPDSTGIASSVVQWCTKAGEKRLIEWRCVAMAAHGSEGHYIMGIGLDITLRKLAQDAAAEAKLFAESIIATVREPLLVLDENLRVKAANRSYYQTFQVMPRETIGCPLFELGERQWKTPALRQLLQTILTENTAFEDFEVKQDFSKIGRRVMLLNARRVFREEGSTAMILLAIEDVTANVEARDALRRSNRELEDRVRERTAELQAANKELEAFSYSVSHDLRAPLRTLDAFSNQLLRDHADHLGEKGRHYLERIRAGTLRMGELIDDLLQLARYGRGKMNRAPIDLTYLARTIAVELQQRDPARQVAFEIQPGLTGQGDSGLLKAVLENLLGNAWKYTGKKTAARIAFGQVERQGRPAFFVRDDGAGFDMRHADKLFGAFQRLHPQQEFTGNGIGLATVQRIIHRHGGQVWAESTPGLGATFYFTLSQNELV